MGKGNGGGAWSWGPGLRGRAMRFMFDGGGAVGS